MLARPYAGVRHDGILYLGQIYLQIEPSVFSRDLFFRYGSQDQFSVFSRLGAVLHSTLGLEGFQFLILLVGHVSLLAAAAWLLGLLADARAKVLGLVCLAVMPHFYGDMGIFSFGETFVTARTLAEPLGLVALVLVVRGRLVLGLLAAAGSALLHPLLAIPVLLAGWLFLALTDRRWVWLAVPVAAMVSTLVGLGVEPFARLSQRYDADWSAVVREANPFVYPLKWAMTSWALSWSSILFLWMAAPCWPERLARLARAVAAVTAGCLLASAVGTELLDNVLLTQLQLWRALWIAQLLALCLLPSAMIALWLRGGPWATFAVAVGAAAIALTAHWFTGPAVLAWALGVGWLAQKRPAALRQREWSLLHRATWLMALLLSLLLLWSIVRQLIGRGISLEPSVLIWVLATSPLLVGAACLALLRWSEGQSPQSERLLALAGLLVLVSGVAFWDRRIEAQKIIETRPAHPHPFALKTAPDSQIYWRESLNHTWAMLGRASYFTNQQGSGVLFDRETAMEYERRRQMFAPLSFQREICMVLAGFDGDENWSSECVPDLELVIEICSAERGPDYLVFPFALARGAISSWTLSPLNALSITYHLHDCKQLRG